MTDVMNVAQVTGQLNPNVPMTELLLPNGQVVRVDTRLLLGADAERAEITAGTDELPAGEAAVIPLIEERLVVTKRTVETGRVRLVKTVQEYEEQMDEPLAVRTFDIERRVLNEPVETAPAVRQEGDTTIYPVVEEQMVLTKRLVLKEELRVTLRDTERIDTQVVTLRREHLTVEREDLSRAGK